jgi:hypothetical protein
MILPTDAQLDERLIRLADTLPSSVLPRRPAATSRRVRAPWAWSAAPVIAAVLIVTIAGASLLIRGASPEMRGGAIGSASGHGQQVAGGSDQAPSPAAATMSSQERVAFPSAAAPSPDAAAIAICDAIRDSVPLVLVRSGVPRVVGANTLDSTSIGAYLGAVQAGINPVTVIGPVAQARTIVCVIDGDFDTRTPGPPGHDTTAKRILVLVRDGMPELWAMTRDPAAMPTPDELAVAGSSAAASPGPVPSGSAPPDGTYLLASHPDSDCGGEGDPRPARIRAAASDPERVWLELDGDRLTAFWPEGTTVRFNGGRPVRIRDADGTVIATAGQRLSDTTVRGCLDMGEARIDLYRR